MNAWCKFLSREHRLVATERTTKLTETKQQKKNGKETERYERDYNEIKSIWP